MSEVINSFAFVNSDDGAHIGYHGPFTITRDGATVEVVIPTAPEDAGAIHPGTADRLTDRVDDLGVAIADGEIHTSGVITAADVVDGELVIRVNGGNYAEPSDVPAEVDDL